MGAGRMRVHGVGRQEKQHKRAATTFQDKLAVIQHYEASRDMQVTVRHFYPELNETERRAKARVVYRWIQLKDSIAAHANSVKTKNQSRIRTVGSATTLGVEGERELVTWIKDLRRKGQHVTSEMLRVRALEVAKERGVPDGAFVASGTWQKSFRERNRQRLRDDSDGDDTEDDDVRASAATRTPAVPTASTGGKRSSASVCASSSGTDAELTQRAAATPVSVASAVNTVSSSSSSSSDRFGIVAQASEQVRRGAAAAAVEATQPRESAGSTARTADQPALSSPAARSRTAASPSLGVLGRKQPAPAARPSSVRSAIAKTAEQAAVITKQVSSSAAAPAATTEAPVATPPPVAEDDAEDRELKRRKAEAEERKAELLNESIRCDNVLKRIRIAEENMLARKRLRDAGIPQDEIDAMLPIHRE